MPQPQLKVVHLAAHASEAEQWPVDQATDSVQASVF